MTTSFNQQHVRRVPILRSISTTPQTSHLESSTSSVRHQRTSSSPFAGSGLPHSSNLHSNSNSSHHLHNLHNRLHNQHQAILSGSLEKLDAPFEAAFSSNNAIDLANTALRMANLRLAAAMKPSSNPTIDRYSSSSGYDSNNSNSSLSHYFVNGGGQSSASSAPSEGGRSTNSTTSTIRRIPSVHSFKQFGSSSSGAAEDQSGRGSSTTTSNLPNNQVFSQHNSSRRNSNSSLRSGISNCGSSITTVNANKNSKRLSFGSGKDIKEEVIHSLDRLEVRVAFLREVAAELLAEKTKLTDALAQIEACCTVNTFSEGKLTEFIFHISKFYFILYSRS